MQVRFIDHIIIGRPSPLGAAHGTRFARRGLIP